jgi:hypothetical protein
MDNEINTTLSSDYLAGFDKVLSISVMARLSVFPFLQQLGFAGQQGSLVQNYHGLQDFVTQMKLYSSAHPVLELGWKAIEQTALLNLKANAQTFADPDLGRVGILFQTMPNFGQVFSVSEQDLANPDQISKSIP